MYGVKFWLETTIIIKLSQRRYCRYKVKKKFRCSAVEIILHMGRFDFSFPLLFRTKGDRVLEQKISKLTEGGGGR